MIGSCPSEGGTGPSDERTSWASLWRLSSLGLEIGFSVALGVLGGWWLNERVGGDGLLVLIGLVIGVIAAGRTLMRSIREPTASETTDEDGPESTN